MIAVKFIRVWTTFDSSWYSLKYDIKHDIKVSLPILKTGCIERCQSRALQVQVQAVQNQ